jgi:hypothetical protein
MSLPASVDQEKLPELLATLKQLQWVDRRLHQLHAARIPDLSPRARYRTGATLRMLDKAMPLTACSIRKVERLMEKIR